MTEHFSVAASADGLTLAAILVMPEGAAGASGASNASSASSAMDASGTTGASSASCAAGAAACGAGEGRSVSEGKSGPAAAKPKAIVQFVHGMCEHKERYEPTMNYLAEHGYACVIHDHRGHGASVKNAEDLGYMYKGGWRTLVEDIAVVNDWIHRRFPGTKIILFGHSMGSMAVRSYLKRHDDTVDALVVCGTPADNPAKGPGKALAWSLGQLKGWHYRSKLLQKLSFGAYNKPFEKEGWPAAWVCSDPKTLKDYHADPLCQYVFTANGFYNLLGLMQDCYSIKHWTLRNPQLPVHFISGAEDPCRGNDSQFRQAVEKLKQAGYTHVTSQLYPGMRHELLNETRRAEVWDDILRYFDKI